MKFTAEKLENNRAQLTVEVPNEQFEVSLQKAFRAAVKKLNVPGFRKGKAPRHIVERLYGREVFLEDALNEAVPGAYMEALEEAGDEYVSVSYPEYEIVQVEKGQPLIFKAVYDLKPEVKLGRYTELELTRESDEVTKERVDEELRKMQERFCRLEVADDAAREHDILMIDFVGKIDGELFDGGSGTGFALELGSGAFIPGFEEQLVGVEAGGEREVNVSFPEAYAKADLAGKQAVFEVKVTEVKRKELSPLDDDFAKDVSEFDTLPELEADVEKSLKEAAKEKADGDLRGLAVKTVTGNAEITVPDSMIQMRIDQLVEDFSWRLARQGLTLDTYIEKSGISMEIIRASYKDRARDEIASDLVVEAVAKAEDIQVSAEEIDQKVLEIAKSMGKEDEFETFKEKQMTQKDIESLEHEILLDKAIDLIIERSKITQKGEEA
ncbi:MAG: trigger factor [Peptococcaceae bacterium]|jgi:trigger factor|nr:trigger factor [Peptococcaceae bacterium]